MLAADGMLLNDHDAKHVSKHKRTNRYCIGKPVEYDDPNMPKNVHCAGFEGGKAERCICKGTWCQGKVVPRKRGTKDTWFQGESGSKGTWYQGEAMPGYTKAESSERGEEIATLTNSRVKPNESNFHVSLFNLQFLIFSFQFSIEN